MKTKKPETRERKLNQNRRNLKQCAFSDLSVLVGLATFLAGAFLVLLSAGASPNPSRLTPASDRSPVKANTHVVGIDNREMAPCSGLGPLVVSDTLITGPDTGVPGFADAGVRLADLDHGLVAGTMRYPYQGIFSSDTYGAFLWSEQGTGATLFHIPDDLVFLRSAYLSNGMTLDGSKVVGGAIFLDYLSNAPWVATRDAGPVEFFKFPAGLEGGAVAVSADGRLVAGIVGGGFHSGPGQAAVWRDGVFQTLPTDQLWSEVGSQFEPIQPFPQRPMNSAGSVIIGASGPSSDRMQATKWVNGVEHPLSTGGRDPQSSVAVFVANNGVIFGTAVLSTGRVVLMRWTADGHPEVLEPPGGLSVVSLSSTDRDGGSAAGGALAMQQSCGWDDDPACNRSPFVWTVRDGFTILPEGGLGQFYDLSTVNDISDGGRVAVGALTASGRSEGDPPDRGFIWTASSGMVFVNDLMAAYGQHDSDYWEATFVSRDGNRVLVTGNPPQATESDTNSLILDLTWPINAFDASGAGTGKR